MCVFRGNVRVCVLGHPQEFCVLGHPQDASIGLPTRGGQTTYRLPRPRVPVQDEL
jgi:hypothetical protein